MRKLPLAAVGTLIALAVWTARPAPAEVLADRIPADALFYAGWAGSDALGAAYDNSNLKAFLDALQLPQFITGRIQADIAKQNNDDPQKKEDAKLLMDTFAALYKAPTAVYLGPLVTTPEGKPMPQIVLLSKIGAAPATDLAKRLNATIERTRQPGSPPGTVIAQGDLLTVVVGLAELPDKFKTLSATDSLKADAGFKLAMAHVGGDKSPAAVIYADSAPVLAMITDAINSAPDRQARQMWPILQEGAGLGALKQLAWAGNFDGKNWQSAGFIGMDNRRVGILSFLDSRPLSDAALKFIPATATMAGVMRFDGTRFLADLQRAATLINDTAPRQLEQGFQQFFAVTGVDMKNDLLPALGDEWIYYGSADAAGNSIRGFAFVNKLKDPAKAETALGSAENFANLMIAQQAPNAKVQFRTEPLAAPLDKVTAHIIGTEKISPAWTIADGVLYIAASLPTLQSAVERGGGPNGPVAKGSLLENPQFLAMRKKAGHDEINSFSYVDLAKSAPEAYELINQGVERAAREHPENAYKLPPLEKILPTLGPALQQFWTDADGFHTHEIGPFPFAGSVSASQFLVLYAIGQTRRTDLP